MLVCHDLKREIEPVSPPLANSLRVIPVLFFVAVAGCAFFTAYFVIQKGAAQRAKMAQERVLAEEKKKTAQVQMKQKALEEDVNKAESMIAWVKGSDVIQPLAMTINKSIDPHQATINRLKLKRAEKNPWQIQMEIKFNGSDPSILEETLLNLEAARYKKFTPRRTYDEEGLNFSATLVKQP